LRSGEIKKRIRELGRAVTAHYGREPFVVIGLMNGAIFFLVDLLRQLPADWEVFCPTVTSYAGAHSTGKVSGLDTLKRDLKGRRILLVDDILDTGLTLRMVSRRLRELGAAQVDICVLLRKRKRRREAVKARWVGFDVPDLFVIGCGFDFHGRYRGLKDIHVFEPKSD